ncbi:MAG TPA: ATP-binding protein [Steroidobacteraceae bacterium]|nr:ATP-binding protein [Steroidobacteraceae bacterium]
MKTKRTGLLKLSPLYARMSRSVRSKLIALVLLTTAMALLVAGLALLTHDLTVSRQAWAADVATEASILALSTAPALAFDDLRVAERNLSALRARDNISAAALYRPSGELYAGFVRPGSRPLTPVLTAPEETRIAGEQVEVVHRVMRSHEWLGTIYLRAHYDVIGRIKAYVGIFALVTVLSMLAALSLSAALQRSITKPLDDIATVARQVVHERDYSLRAQKTTDDEFGLLIEAFNNMLSEVQSRTRALEESNRSLRTEMTTREAAEAALVRSEKLYRAIGESIDYGVWVTDAQGRCIYASDSFLRLVDMTQQQCSQLGWASALHPDDQRDTLAAWEDCVRTGATWYREHRIRGNDGRYHPVLAQGVPIRDEHGATTGWAGINLDISRIKQTEEALRDADRRKDEFLATLAHELRNPLAPIRHATRILDSAAATAEQKQWGREVIARQVQHMALLLDDLLDISRITRGRLELRKEYVELDKLVATAVETARPIIENKHHTLEIVLPAEPVGLYVDPLRMSQALSNILTNAAKYTDAGGRITLTGTVGAAGIAIAVRDSGIGLTEAAIANVFEMFSQVQSALERSQGGLGIGLALVQGLVNLHGGTVEATSAGIGAGSTFTIRLTSASLAQPVSVLPSSLALDAGDGTRRRMLVVDDNRDAADSLEVLLGAAGHDVYKAHTGRDALNLALRARPDVLILDIGIPDMSGYELAERLRQEAWARAALFIAVTGWGQREDKERAQRAGFDHHFTKPVEVQELEACVSRFFGSRAPAHEAATS